MKNFPTTFSTQTTALEASILQPADAELVRQLGAKGYEIHVGLTVVYADQIAKMCQEPAIKEYCPEDASRRFTSRAATEDWLTRGRVPFLLLKREGADLQLVGYGWAGAKTSPHVPGGESTFSVRLGEASRGQGLAMPFSRLIIAAIAALYGAQNMWLETWDSNGAAVHIYHKLGFEDIDQAEDERPTANGHSVADTRLYMSLPNQLLK